MTDGNTRCLEINLLITVSKKTARNWRDVFNA